MLLGESRTWDEHHRGIEKVEYIPTDSESIRGTRSENRPRAKVGVSGMTKPINQWTLYSQIVKSKDLTPNFLTPNFQVRPGRGLP
jgi:hypothetical protein